MAAMAKSNLGVVGIVGNRRGLSPNDPGKSTSNLQFICPETNAKPVIPLDEELIKELGAFAPLHGHSREPSRDIANED